MFYVLKNSILIINPFLKTQNTFRTSLDLFLNKFYQLVFFFKWIEMTLSDHSPHPPLPHSVTLWVCFLHLNDLHFFISALFSGATNFLCRLQSTVYVGLTAHPWPRMQKLWHYFGPSLPWSSFVPLGQSQIGNTSRKSLENGLIQCTYLTPSWQACTICQALSKCLD
jgi:hypothetical protein